MTAHRRLDRKKLHLNVPPPAKEEEKKPLFPKPASRGGGRGGPPRSWLGDLDHGGCPQKLPVGCCTVCGRQFPTSQALGGHMTAHRRPDRKKLHLNVPPPAEEEEKMPLFDLNLPPPKMSLNIDLNQVHHLPSAQSSSSVSCGFIEPKLHRCRGSCLLESRVCWPLVQLPLLRRIPHPEAIVRDLHSGWKYSGGRSESVNFILPLLCLRPTAEASVFSFRPSCSVASAVSAVSAAAVTVVAAAAATGEILGNGIVSCPVASPTAQRRLGGSVPINHRHLLFFYHSFN
ncbi:hypothetical protein EJ110_NYTH35099 [Nymphaea thermarum]|nr:hypothetical protein EJ110_NYTH35099 [Nymphaea thermarum]